MRIILVLLFLTAAPLAACSGSDPQATAPATAELTTVSFSVQGMTCEGCEQAITQALLQQPGVTEAGASHEAGTAWAKAGPDAPSPTTLAGVISELGYQASPAAGEP